LEIPRITLIIPAYNEQAHILTTIGESAKIFDTLQVRYEIFVINDGSRDRTGELIEEYARSHPQVRVLHNERNRGYGYTCQRGIREARGEYIGYISADTLWDPQALGAIIRKLGQSDIITVYTPEADTRSLLRRFISRGFTTMMNMLFGLRIRYYNGPSFHRRELVQAMTIYSEGLTIWAEILIRLIKSGHSYQELPASFAERTTGRSTALKFKNIWATVKIVAILVREVYFSSEH